MKKICLVVCNLISGGVESVLLNYFSNIKDDFEVELITYGIGSQICYNSFLDLGFTIHIIPRKKDGFLKSYRAMEKIIRNGNFDVVHAHLNEWNCIPIHIAKKYNVPLRISHSHIAEPVHGIKKLMLLFQRKIILKDSNKLCACGIMAAKYLYGESLLKSGKVKIINNAINIDKFKYNEEYRRSMRAQYDIKDSDLVIGHIGRFVKQKNHIFLINIFNEIVKIEPSAKLMLMGRGELEDNIKNQLKQLKIENNVIFLGVNNFPEKLYSCIDVFCFPSLFEGLPVVLVEAQASGVPIVTSNTITNEIFLSENISVLKLNQNYSEWAKEVRSVRYNRSINLEKIDKYNINKCVGDWVELYE